ncbi:MAG: hypothetical protein MJ127_03805, partial [Mogibacterium sp.]|nr:hypothetical protein [Mogibacterium sp.]
MIKIDKVNKYFFHGKPNQIHVINNTSMELPDRGIVCLLGPSGGENITTEVLTFPLSIADDEITGSDNVIFAINNM